jgi:Ser/Thr protein kinase RdoA (MazF antagonist)
VTAIHAIAAQFGGSVTAVAPFGGGHINQTFLAQTPDADYVVQRINRAVFADPEAVMANILVVRRHLGGALVPEPMPARDGRWLVYDGRDAWRAWRRAPNAAPTAEITPDTAGSAARLLGRFHAALADLDPLTITETLPRFHDPGRRLAALRTAVAEDAVGRVATVSGEIAEALDAAPLVELAAALTARVPTRVAHNDAKLDNVLFREGEAVCLVDLDTLMPGAWFWDVGDLLRTASTTAPEDDPISERAVVDPELYRAVIDGYRFGVEPASDASETEALEVAGAIVTYEQALRFLTDWIEGDVYYRTSRPGQNLDRARAQLRLLASMPGTVTSP